MPAVRSIDDIMGDSYAMANQGRLQDEERAIRADQAHFEATGINILTAPPPDVSEEDLIIMNGVHISPRTRAYRCWEERQLIVEEREKVKANAELEKEIEEQKAKSLGNNPIALLKL